MWMSAAAQMEERTQGVQNQASYSAYALTARGSVDFDSK
jgi:hypothetical protein